MPSPGQSPTSTLNMMNSERYLRTKSIYLAAYILAKGGELAGIEAGPDGVFFCFVRFLECENFAEEFNTAREALIDARVFISALQILYRERQEEFMKFHARKDQT